MEEDTAGGGTRTEDLLFFGDGAGAGSCAASFVFSRRSPSRWPARSVGVDVIAVVSPGRAAKANRNRWNQCRNSTPSRHTHTHEHGRLFFFQTKQETKLEYNVETIPCQQRRHRRRSMWWVHFDFFFWFTIVVVSKSRYDWIV